MTLARYSSFHYCSPQIPCSSEDHVALTQRTGNQFSRGLVNAEEPPAPQVIKLMKVQRAHSLSPRSGPAAQTGLQFLLHQVYGILLGQERRGIKSPSLKPTQMGLDTLTHYSCPAPSTAYLRRAINIRQSSHSSRNQRRINLEEKRGKITSILLSP